MTGAAGPPHAASAFGLNWLADLPLPQFRSSADDAEVDISIARMDALPERAVLHRIHRGEVYADGFRLRWGEEVVFDVRHNPDKGHTTIGWCPGAAWRGAFPHALFGTVTGLIMAWRGALPVHACAVALDGRAVLICGPSGAGKSTLAAGLAAEGGVLLSDDLSVLTVSNGAEWVQLGRPALRLYPEIASWVSGAKTTEAGPGARGKLLVRPVVAPAITAAPLAAIVLISDALIPDAAVLKVAILREQLFRPRWLVKLPGQRERLARLASIAASIPMLTLAPAPQLDAAGWRMRAAAAAAQVRGQLG